jgi:hypothetical protein
MTLAPHLRRHFTTDKQLVELALRVPLNPLRGRAVFYAEDEGGRLAQAFLARHPSHTRLDELLRDSSDGMKLLDRIGPSGRRRWSNIEEVWWELSWRLARAASGEVNCFGPQRLLVDRPIEESRHRRGRAFVNTIFEKIELPALEENPRVTAIFINGRRWG